MMPKYHLLFSLCLLVTLGQACRTLPKGGFDTSRLPSAPDYSDPENWAALPTRVDAADILPAPQLEDRQQEAPVDVFFLHPTTYSGQKGDTNWNASITDKDVNERTDEGPIQYQATIFNGVGRVYAPRYRQGHLHMYYTKTDSVAARRALEVAYQDVRRAFLYYWEHYNNGRPLIIASHSQGTNHAERLVKEFFDGQDRQDQLIVAYLVGMPIRKDAFEHIPPCKTAEQTGCFVSWRTFRRGYEPQGIPLGDQIVATNPLIWTVDTTYADATLNLGAVLRPFDKIYPAASDAQVHNGIIWASKPRFRGSFLFNRKNYHIGDYNIYYLNVRENVKLRANNYLGRR